MAFFSVFLFVGLLFSLLLSSRFLFLCFVDVKLLVSSHFLFFCFVVAGGTGVRGVIHVGNHSPAANLSSSLSMSALLPVICVGIQ